MTQDLERSPGRAINPKTGELFDLALPTADLLLAMAQARELKDEAQVFHNIVGREVLARMDRNGSWTTSAMGVKATGRSPEPPEEYDAEKLFRALVVLVHQDVITEEAAASACEVSKTYKAKLQGIKALKKIGPEVAAALEECRIEKDAEEYKRSRPAPSVTITTQAPKSV